jgi:hypothetical protein
MTAIEQFASTHEGRALLEREMERLNTEIELADFQHYLRREEARQRVCEAAMAWYDAIETGPVSAVWRAEDQIYEAVGVLRDGETE